MMPPRRDGEGMTKSIAAKRRSRPADTEAPFPCVLPESEMSRAFPARTTATAAPDGAARSSSGRPGNGAPAHAAPADASGATAAVRLAPAAAAAHLPAPTPHD